ncbi:MAG: hypothetical protein FWF38_00800 [Spirochaetaceae bacterium]|nr:hypothetical protein [Spirochaetaceae bacterium]
MEDLKLAVIGKDKKRTVIDINGIKTGKDFVVIAGPYSVETEEQTIKTALAVKKAGANMLRGGAFKPRTSPYAFQGLGIEGLKILEKAHNETGLPIVTEVVDVRDLSRVCEYADVIQIEPEKAMSDSDQQLNPHDFAKIMSKIKKIKQCYDTIVVEEIG